MRRTPIRFLISACVAATILLPGCSGGKDNQQQRQSQQTRTETNTTIQTAGDLGDSLDLSRLPSLVKQAKNGQELEEILNTSGVNNLDTNGDGKVDYLNVEEGRENGAQGFILYTNENNERIDVARIDVTKTQSTADVAVSGNPAYYGNQPVQYRSSFPLGEILLAAWLFDLARPRYYHPPYYAGYYPRYYKSYSPISRAAYRSRVSTGSFSVKGKPLVASASKRTVGGASTFATGSNSRTMTGGKSFSTTTNKRGSVSNSTGFGSSSRRTTGTGSSTSTGTTRFGNDTSTRSSTGQGSFGSNSNRRRPSFSFGNSGSSGSSTSTRSGSGFSFGGSSSRSSSGSRSRSSFGGGSSRRRR